LLFFYVFQNDILSVAKKIAELNNWNHNYILKDIRNCITDNYEFPSADVIIGGFPCQDFSHAGKRKGFNAERGTLYQSYVEVVRRIKPIIFVAENVNGLLTMTGNPIKNIIDDFTAVGYEVKYQLIKCEDFGIPQTRHRVIIMGIRLDCRNNLTNDWNVITENKKTCAIKHYFMHLEEPDQSTDIAQQSYSKAAKLDKGQGQTEIKINGFCPTIRAEHHGNIEFRRIKEGKNNENNLLERRLTIREAALIQTFPPNCILTGKKPSCMAYKPIGNAVPPLLGYIIARKVQQILQQYHMDRFA
jgi:DNA (cytosine-5)-methyltransferase 1